MVFSESERFTRLEFELVYYDSALTIAPRLLKCVDMFKPKNLCVSELCEYILPGYLCEFSSYWNICELACM